MDAIADVVTMAFVEPTILALVGSRLGGRLERKVNGKETFSSSITFEPHIIHLPSIANHLASTHLTILPIPLSKRHPSAIPHAEPHISPSKHPPKYTYTTLLPPFHASYHPQAKLPATSVTKPPSSQLPSIHHILPPTIPTSDLTTSLDFIQVHHLQV
ncbi:unnamed protein product [Vicia faba]|uniref:Uncharacterized protein n=1 Tax=Vicia faba TaxID=3906 RepID=A0AAV0ZRH1_VICFA|nr:unnamed protein product [Vicia faba]